MAVDQTGEPEFDLSYLKDDGTKLQENKRKRLSTIVQQSKTGKQK